MSGSYYGASISYALPDHCCLNLISFFVSLPSLEMGNTEATASLFTLLLGASDAVVELPQVQATLKFLFLVLICEIFNDLDFPLL